MCTVQGKTRELEALTYALELTVAACWCRCSILWQQYCNNDCRFAVAISPVLPHCRGLISYCDFRTLINLAGVIFILITTYLTLKNLVQTPQGQVSRRQLSGHFHCGESGGSNPYQMESHCRFSARCWSLQIWGFIEGHFCTPITFKIIHFSIILFPAAGNWHGQKWC